MTGQAWIGVDAECRLARGAQAFLVLARSVAQARVFDLVGRIAARVERGHAFDLQDGSGTGTGYRRNQGVDLGTLSQDGHGKLSFMHMKRPAPGGSSGPASRTVSRGAVRGRRGASTSRAVVGCNEKPGTLAGFEVAGDIPGGHTCTSMTTLYRPIPGSTTLRNQYTAICAGHTSIDVHMRPVSQRQARNAACNSSS